MIRLPSAYQPLDLVSVHNEDGFLFNGIVEAVRFTERSFTYEVIANGMLRRDIDPQYIKDPIVIDKAE